MGWKEKDKASTYTTDKLSVKKKAIKEMCAGVIRSKANESEKLVNKLIVLKISLG